MELKPLLLPPIVEVLHIFRTKGMGPTGRKSDLEGLLNIRDEHRKWPEPVFVLEYFHERSQFFATNRRRDDNTPI
jgi:hypothetical protein